MALNRVIILYLEFILVNGSPFIILNTFKILLQTNVL